MQLENPVDIFTVVLLLVLIVPLLFSRLRISGIAGLILAGMIAGPNGIGLLTRDGTFELLGKVGLLYLMFLAGLEISLREFRHNIRNTLTFGSLTFLFPQIIGTVIAYRLGLNWPAAILMASMFASHTLVPYPIIQKLGLGKHRAVSTTVGGTILTDTAAMLVLAVVAESVRAGETGINWPVQLLLLTLLVVFGIYLLPRMASWFYRALEPDGITEFVFILSAAFLTSSLAQLAGVEGIIGAFLAGLALSSLVPEQSIIMRRLQFTGNALFIPFFLLATGMLINPRVFLSDIRTIQMCLFMTSTGIITKWLAAEISGRILGFSQPERRVVYGLSVNQAAATLAAVMVGYNLGIFDISILNGTIAMIMVTCMIGPLITEKFAPKLAEEASSETQQVSASAQGPLLVSVSNESHMYNLLDLAVLVRENEADNPMHVLNVAMELGSASDAIGHSETLLGQVIARLASGGIKATPQIRVDVNPTRAILRTLRELRIDTLVLGSSPSTARNFFTESLSTQVLQGSPCMTLVAENHNPLNTCRRTVMIIPPLLEYHPGLRRVLHTAARLARQIGTPMVLTGCQQTIDSIRNVRKLPDEILKAELFTRETFPLLIKDFSTYIEQHDLIMIINNRAGSPGWQPALDRLPRELRKREETPNVVMVFPPLPSGSSAREEAEAETDADDMSEICPGADHIEMDFDVCPPIPSAAVRLILETQHKVVIPVLGQWVRALSEMEPVELDDGIVLLHTHARETLQPRIFTARFEHKGEWSTTKSPVGMLILLVSPADSPPEKHLQTLAAIVKWVRGKHKEEPVSSV